MSEMETHREQVDFYDVAARFTEEASSSKQPHRLLKVWAHRYPEYAADLAAVAYAHLVEPNVDLQTAANLDSSSVVAAAQRVLNRFSTPATPLKSIIQVLADKGLKQKNFADSLHIDIPLLAKLEQRLLEVASIPDILIKQLASGIGRTKADIIAYLSQAPTLAPEGRYKSGQTPTVPPTRQNFLDAIEKSSILASDQKEYWRSEVRRENEP
jgi:hypothetical protein